MTNNEESSDADIKQAKKTRNPKYVYRNGIPQFPSTGKVVTDEEVRRLIEQEDIDLIEKFVS